MRHGLETKLAYAWQVGGIQNLDGKAGVHEDHRSPYSLRCASEANGGFAAVDRDESHLESVLMPDLLHFSDSTETHHRERAP